MIIINFQLNKSTTQKKFLKTSVLVCVRNSHNLKLCCEQSSCLTIWSTFSFLILFFCHWKFPSISKIFKVFFVYSFATFLTNSLTLLALKLFPVVIARPVKVFCAGVKGFAFNYCKICHLLFFFLMIITAIAKRKYFLFQFHRLF